jgi:hypothetical protein
MDTTQNKIVNTLRKIGSVKCLEKATEIENAPSLSNLHLRSLDLTASEVILLVKCLRPDVNSENSLIESISFSYNSKLGDEGAISLAKNLPVSIREMGLVSCGVNDEGGTALLEWMKKAPHLRMVCIEGNNFSHKIKNSFRKFRILRPHVLFVFD